MSARALREIAIVSLLRRDREDFATCLEGGTHSRRRERRVTDHADDFFELWPRPWQIAGYLNIKPLRLTALCIDQVNVAGLFVYNRIRASRRRHDVEVIVMRKLCELLRIRSVSEQVHRVIAIGKKIDRVANPHRQRVVAV